MSRCLVGLRCSVWPYVQKAPQHSALSSAQQLDEVVKRSEPVQTSRERNAAVEWLYCTYPFENVSCSLLRDLTDNDFLQLEFRERMKLVLVEYGIWKRMETCGIPEVLLYSQLEHLCTLQPRMARLKYLGMLRTLEHRWSGMRGKKMFCYDFLKKYKLHSSDERTADEQQPSDANAAATVLMLQLTDKLKQQLYAQRNVTATLCGSPEVVIDMSWQLKQNMVERQHVCRHLRSAIKTNYQHTDPFRIHVTSFSAQYWEDSPEFQMQKFKMCYDYFVQFSDRHFTELFPREQLIYLTPDGETELLEFSPDKVYIVGGIVDLFATDIHTVDKARAAGIATVRLPLELCSNFTPANRLLPFWKVLSILLHLRQHGQIVDALELLRLPNDRRIIRTI